MATQTRNPTSDAAFAGTWTGTGGVRYQSVDDYPDSGNPIADGITHGTATPGFILFGFTPFSIPTGSTGLSVSVLYYDFKAASQACSIAACLRQPGNVTAPTGAMIATTHNPGQGNAAIALRTDTFATNPFTAAAWTVAELNGGTNGLGSFGWSSADANPAITLSCIQLQVTYTPPPPAITAAVEGTDSFGYQQTAVTITGTTFEATQGTGKVELASSSTYATATKVLQTVTSWSDTSIDFTAVLGGLTPGALFLFVTSTNGGTSTGRAVTVTVPPGAAWLAALNTPISVDVSSGNVQLRLRVGIVNTGGPGTVVDYKYKQQRNALGYVDITTTSSMVKTFATSDFADEDDVPQLITGGTYQTNNDAADETGGFTLPSALGGDVSFESEIALELIAADLTNGDTLQFRIVELDETLLDTYTQLPSITIVKGVAAADVPKFRRRRMLPGRFSRAQLR
jgi:hypothetical protein